MRLGPLERHAATGLALWERAIGRPDARARRLDVTPQGQDMCWRAVGRGADYHANTVRPHRERRKTLTGNRRSNDRFGANQLVSANDRKWPGAAVPNCIARDQSAMTQIDPKSPVATDGYRASLGKHITGKSQMRWIRVVASPLHPNSKQGDGRCRCFLR